LSGMLYIGAILGLSVLVSALTRRSSTAFVFLLCLWVVGVLVVPRASVLLAARSVEVPSMDQLLSQRSRLWAQLGREDQKVIGDFLKDNFSSDDDAPRPDLAAEFNSKFDELADERQAKLGALDARLAEERRNRQLQQQRLALGLARVSPASVFSLASSHLARTSLDLPQYYLAQVEAYQERFAAFQKEKTGRSAGGGIRMIVKTGDEDEEEPGPIDPADLPAFEWKPAAASRAIQAGMFDLSLLALFNLLFFAGAFVAFLRYDVR
jgi:ABC-type transport system involved in multi-copper enzyme maturation permease subunit